MQESFLPSLEQRGGNSGLYANQLLDRLEIGPRVLWITFWVFCPCNHVTTWVPNSNIQNSEVVDSALCNRQGKHNTNRRKPSPSMEFPEFSLWPRGWRLRLLWPLIWQRDRRPVVASDLPHTESNQPIHPPPCCSNHPTRTYNMYKDSRLSVAIDKRAMNHALSSWLCKQCAIVGISYQHTFFFLTFSRSSLSSSYTLG